MRKLVLGPILVVALVVIGMVPTVSGLDLGGRVDVGYKMAKSERTLVEWRAVEPKGETGPFIDPDGRGRLLL